MDLPFIYQFLTMNVRIDEMLKHSTIFPRKLAAASVVQKIEICQLIVEGWPDFE